MMMIIVIIISEQGLCSVQSPGCSTQMRPAAKLLFTWVNRKCSVLHSIPNHTVLTEAKCCVPVILMGPVNLAWHLN